MDLKKVRELIELMKENDLSEVELRTGEDRIALKRGYGDVSRMMMVPAAATTPVPATASASEASAGGPGPADEAHLHTIASPMVGTFYTSPDPESPPFVEVGSRVNADQTVCIIEAMKVFNEIKAEVSGVIHTIHVQRDEAVEYGQPLFSVRTSG
jgi:acetyl-CoA carboxylase biotin carboxyl carrier protein